MASSATTRVTPLGTSRRGSRSMQQALAYLRPSLPTGWHDYFSPRRAGRYWGLSIVCPRCEEKPPVGVESSAQRWRWLSVHLAQHRR